MNNVRAAVWSNVWDDVWVKADTQTWDNLRDQIGTGTLVWIKWGQIRTWHLTEVADRVLEEIREVSE